MDTLVNYDFLAPSKTVFGWGRRREAGLLGRSLGRRAFIVSGLPEEIEKSFLPEICAALRQEAVEVVPAAHILHEPEVDDVDRLSAQLRREKPVSGDFMLALGGGSAIDLAKAAGAMATNDQSSTVKDYLENVGRDLKIVNAPLPVLAMPTTAGTGAEATKNAVISCYNPPFKKSLRDDRLMPRIALVDPELTVSVPVPVTAASGMDAITQLFESYITRNARPIPQALAVQGLKMAIPAIVQAVEKPDSRRARGHGPRGPAFGFGIGQFRFGNGPRGSGGIGNTLPRAARDGLCADAARGAAGQQRSLRRTVGLFVPNALRAQSHHEAARRRGDIDPRN